MVIGGGPAGVAAAVAAARQGAAVFLAENAGSFGGAAANALIPLFMQFTDGVHFLAGGIGQEVRDYIGTHCPESMKPYCPDSIPIETLKRCYDDLVIQSGVQFSFFTSVLDAVTEQGRIKYAVCHSKSEIYGVKAKIFIDCTGDGDFCAMAGAEFQMGDEEGGVMASTLCGLWANIDWDRVQLPDSRRLEDAFRDGIFTNEDRHLPGMWPIGAGIGGSNTGHLYGIDGTRGDSLTQGMVLGRRQIQEYRKYYREYLEGYEKAELVFSAPMLGVRESRRIVGDYLLNVEDFLSRAVFPDEIGRYCYPIDIHSSTNTNAGYEEYAKTFAQMRYQPGESYGIPYRSLMVKGFDNLLTAGRCISTDRQMQASVRVMPGCFITGQAAGVAAALSAAGEGDVRKIDCRQLQKNLKALGAYLPNAAE